MDVLEIYIIEIERQLDRKVKIVRSDRGDEYYEFYDSIKQCSSPFIKLLKKRGICAQYIMLGMLQ